MEGHAAMDMSVGGDGSFWTRLRSPEGFTSVSHIFVMEWAAVLRDIVIGLLIAGAVAAWVPETFWQRFFLTDDGTLAKIWGPIVGPLVAVVSFVCSIGNVPLAAVLWNGGISFGGVISFIFADLIILPIIVIYKKYYGWRMALFVTGCFYVTMVGAGYVVEILFGALGVTPTDRSATVLEASVSWNYTTFLNLAFLGLAAVLLIRFVRSGGIPMLKMMGGQPETAGHGHDQRGERRPVSLTEMGLAADLGYTHRPINAFQRLMQSLGATPVGAWFFSKTLQPMDRVCHRLTRGRTSVPQLLAGLPVLFVTTTGRKSGRQRTTPLISVPIHDTLALIGTNFGQSPTPGWVFNLEADPAARVRYRDVELVVSTRPATDGERAAVWKAASTVYPGYDKYQERITGRDVRIFVLEPADAG